jgi:hypothetical protein
MWGLWGNVGICGDLWGFVGKCGVCGETHALRILGSYGENEKKEKVIWPNARLLSIRKVGICLKMSVCCRPTRRPADDRRRQPHSFTTLQRRHRWGIPTVLPMLISWGCT